MGIKLENHLLPSSEMTIGTSTRVVLLRLHHVWAAELLKSVEVCSIWRLMET